MKYTDEKQFAAANIFGKGQPNDAYARYFAGHSFLNPLTKAGECPIAMSNVTFEPGCRNNWHIHHAGRGGGQMLICTAGEGWYQERARRRRASRLARWSISPPASSTGTARRRTAGLPTSPSTCPARTPPTNGSSR